MEYTGVISLASNGNNTVISLRDGTLHIYDNKIHYDQLVSILEDPNVLKIIDTNKYRLEYLNNIQPKRYVDIITFVKNNNHSSWIPKIKGELSIASITDAADIMMRYVILSHPEPILGPKEKKDYFDYKRDCYLLYLTIYNEIIMNYGPLPFVKIIGKLNAYPRLCRHNMSPANALEGLLCIGALIIDRKTTIISLP